MSRNLSVFANIRTAIDVFRGRLPGALAMLRAKDIAITTHSKGGQHWNTVTFFFDDDSRSCGNAYRACERLYEMNHPQLDALSSSTPSQRGGVNERG